MKIPAFIKRLAKVCDKESSRYALGGIKCESDGQIARMTATDGRILATVHWKDDDPAEVNVIADSRTLRSIPAKAFLHPKGVWFDGSTVRAVVGTDRTETTVTSVEGRFPNYEKVISIHDQPEGYVSVRVDAELLGTLCDLAHDMNRDADTKGITLFVKDAQSCVFACATSPDGHTARLAIMPRAPDGKYQIAPFPPRPEAAPAAESKGGKRRKDFAPPPECLDDEAIAAAVTAEPATIDDFGTAVSPL